MVPANASRKSARRRDANLESRASFRSAGKADGLRINLPRRFPSCERLPFACRERILKIIRHIEIRGVADGATHDGWNTAACSFRKDGITFHFHRFRLASQLPLLVRLALPRFSMSPCAQSAARRNRPPWKATRDGWPPLLVRRLR